MNGTMYASHGVAMRILNHLLCVCVQMHLVCVCMRMYTCYTQQAAEAILCAREP